ncbi:MAG: hypothetical protein ACK40K_02090 [Raineya sp.]
MKTINLSDEDFEKLLKLSLEYDEIYGDENETVWDIDDLEALRQIGHEFMSLVLAYLEKIQKNA